MSTGRLNKAILPVIYFCEPPHNRCAVHLPRTCRPYSLLLKKWRPLSLRKWESTIKHCQFWWSDLLLNIAILLVIYINKAIKKRTFSSTKDLKTHLVLWIKWSLCLLENENQSLSCDSSDGLLLFWTQKYCTEVLNTEEWGMEFLRIWTVYMLSGGLQNWFTHNMLDTEDKRSTRTVAAQCLRVLIIFNSMCLNGDWQRKLSHNSALLRRRVDHQNWRG